MKRSILLLLALSFGLWLGCGDEDDDTGKGGSSGRGKDAGKTSEGGTGGTGGASADAGLCAKLGNSCAKTACCKENDLTCVRESTGAATCYAPCAANDECQSECCTDPKDTGDKVCAPKTACDNPCGKEGASCKDETDCCQGVCVTGTTNPDYVGCRRACKKSGDCESGCCRLFADSDEGFCAAARHCSCGKVDAKCGPTEPECCDGTVCAGLAENEEMSCRTKCKEDSDCASKCCTLAAAGEDYGVCYEGC